MTVEQSHLVDLKMESRIAPETIFGLYSMKSLAILLIYMSGGMDLTHRQLQKLRFQIIIDDEEPATRY